MRYVYKKKIKRIFFSAVDALGTIALYPLRLLPAKKINDGDNILVIRLDQIGDVAISTCVIRPLREAFPEARVDFMAASSAKDIVKWNGSLNKIVEFTPSWFSPGGSPVRDFFSFLRMVRLLRQGRYSAAIDLRGDFRHILAMFLAGIPRRISYGITGGGFLLTDRIGYDWGAHEYDRDLALLGALGITVRPPVPFFSFPAEDERMAAAIMTANGLREKMFALIHVFPGREEKEWSVTGFSDVAAYLSSRDIVPVLVGGRKDGARIRGTRLQGKGYVDLCGGTKLGEFFYLCVNCACFIGVDSGPSHIAAGSGCPVILLFSGVNSPSEWAPRGGNVKLVYPGDNRKLSSVSPEDVKKIIDEVMT
jgi:ADP-heptose:LPS heptosyltransferase